MGERLGIRDTLNGQNPEGIFFWQHYNSEKVYSLDFLPLLLGSFIDMLAFPSLAQQKICNYDFLAELYVVRRKIFPSGFCPVCSFLLNSNVAQDFFNKYRVVLSFNHTFTIKSAIIFFISWFIMPGLLVAIS